MRNLTLCSLCVLLALFVTTPSAWSQLVTPDPDFPPDGEYVSPGGAIVYSGIGVTLDGLVFTPLPVSAVLTDVGADEHATFNATFDAVGASVIIGPFQLAGPVSTIFTGKAGNTTGTFDTEIVSMSLTGDSSIGPIIIREAPAIPSTGQTDITDLGGGLYDIDSFFDIFTELSVDGGANWFASDDPIRITLVPEPTSLCLFGLGMLGLLKRRKS